MKKYICLLVMVAFIACLGMSQTIPKTTTPTTKSTTTKVSAKPAAETQYKLNEKGEIIAVRPTSGTTTDKVYAVIDGKTFYKSKNDKIYYFRTSKKTGKQYRCYVKNAY